MHFNRDEIGLRPARGKYFLERRDVRGVALHWPGMKTPLGNPERVKSALRSWQALHMDTDQIAPGGASDIAYQIAIDQAGNTYQLRGLRYRSGANGGTTQNRDYGAILLVLAVGEKPSDDMIRSLRRRIAAHRRIFPGSTEIVGHREIRDTPTACPGDKIQALIDQGKLDPYKEPIK